MTAIDKALQAVTRGEVQSFENLHIIPLTIYYCAKRSFGLFFLGIPTVGHRPRFNVWPIFPLLYRLAFLQCFSRHGLELRGFSPFHCLG